VQRFEDTNTLFYEAADRQRRRTANLGLLPLAMME
jgi:hypothetical protein